MSTAPARRKDDGAAGTVPSEPGPPRAQHPVRGEPCTPGRRLRESPYLERGLAVVVLLLFVPAPEEQHSGTAVLRTEERNLFVGRGSDGPQRTGSEAQRPGNEGRARVMSPGAPLVIGAVRRRAKGPAPYWVRLNSR